MQHQQGPTERRRRYFPFFLTSGVVFVWMTDSQLWLSLILASDVSKELMPSNKQTSRVLVEASKTRP
jgi:hypothetical protein